MIKSRTPKLGAALVIGAMLTLGACSSNSSDTTIVAADSAASSMATDAMSTDAMSTEAMTTDAMSTDAMTSDAAGSAAMAPFGPGCAAVPADGAGSFAGMAQDPAATAASNNPALSTLVAAVKAAGLVDTLNGPGPFTIFAPTNDAFAKIDPATLTTVMGDPKGALTKILTLHVISGKAMTAAELLSSASSATVQGGTLAFTGSGQDVTVNGSAKVVCGDVKVGNGIVHIIDTVLMPA